MKKHSWHWYLNRIDYVLKTVTLTYFKSNSCSCKQPSTFQALCADAGDEESEVIRFHDRSLIEVSQVPDRLANLLKRLEILFVDKGAKNTGYTAYVLNYLAKERLVRLTDGTLEQLS